MKFESKVQVNLSGTKVLPRFLKNIVIFSEGEIARFIQAVLFILSLEKGLEKHIKENFMKLLMIW